MSRSISVLNKYLLVLSIIWTLLFCIYYFTQRQILISNTVSLATKEASTAFYKDTLYRKWVSSMGGVYVAVSDTVKPNPFLADIPDRDIQAPNGKTLTLINPAYMTRMVYELSDKNVVQGHLTSDKLKNPINKPDRWEVLALEEIYSGKEIYSSLDTINGEPYLRFMKPFITEEGCLKCHAYQGYKPGDIRGGVSVMVPMKGYYHIRDKEVINLGIFVAIIWTFGMLVLLVSYKNLYEKLKKEEELNSRLVKSEQNFKSLFESIDDIVFVTNMHGCILFANGAAKTRIASDEEEIPGRYIKDLFATDCRGDVVNMLKHRSKEPVRVYSLALSAGDGKLIPVNTSMTFGTWDNEESIFFILNDLSKEQEALSKFTALFENSPSMTAIIKMPEMIFADVNRSFIDILGYDREEIIGTSAAELDIFTDPDEYLNTAQVLGMNLVSKELNASTRSGAVRNVILSSEQVIINGTGYTISVMTDITEKKQAEREIGKQADLIRNLLDTIPDLISYKDVNGVYTGCNAAFAHFHGKAPKVIIGRTASELYKPEMADLIGQHDKNIIRTNTSSAYKQWMTGSNGQKILFETLKVPFRNSGGELIGVLSVSRDITEMDSINNQLIKLNTNLHDTIEKEMEKSRKYEQMLFNQKKMADLGKLITAISHHWRQPLNVLGLYIQDLMMNYEDHALTDEYMHGFSGNSLDTIKKMSDMIDSFKNSLKSDEKSGRIDLIKQTESLLKLSEAEFVSCNISLLFQMKIKDSAAAPAHDRFFVYGDIELFNQAIINILDNAKDAVLDGLNNGLITKGMVKVTVEVTDKIAKLVFEDNGAQIPDDIADKIFNPYFTTKQEGSGTGIGLYLAKTAIEKDMGGQLFFQNTDSGVEFIIKLKLA